MSLHLIDLLIIAAYIVATLAIGFWISKRASRSMEHYFLGGNTIPWYMLGLSNASGMFDISGTMWMVYLLFIYGVKSVWIPWLWPVFNQIIMMVFLSIWLRRSGVMTGAEWIKFRFGEGRGAHLAHIIVVVFAILNVIGFLAYGFIGIGKFAAAFLPWELSANPATNVNLYGLIITGITTVYVVKGGMFSVVFTEVLQFFIMTVACIAVGVIAMNAVSPDMIAPLVPGGWNNLFFGWTLDLDWGGIMDSANTAIAEDGFSWFSIFFMLMLFKGMLQSGAGPAPNYDMQRVLSARTPKDAAKMSGLVSLVLLVPRYMLITGLTVLAIAFFSTELTAMGEGVDFELILPWAMANFVPVGLLGLLIAALLAAFMSTYAATVNAAPAYIVNDIYKRYINPDASEKVYVRMSYLTSVLVVVVGTAFGFIIPTLNSVVMWIVGALYGGYTAANLLKWYWWRFNSYGYFWGMVGGLVAATFVPEAMAWIFGPEAFGEAAPVYGFPIILLVSIVGCVWGSLATAPDDEEVLKNFYLKVRPWGFWRPIHEKVLAEHPEMQKNRAFKRDMANVLVGIIWQTALTATGIFLVLQDFVSLAYAVAVVVVTSAILKLNWYDKMEDYPADLSEREVASVEAKHAPAPAT
ncbi:MAG: sodium:solute symporter family protein [Bacteroidota bacterium]